MFGVIFVMEEHFCVIALLLLVVVVWGGWLKESQSTAIFLKHLGIVFEYPRSEIVHHNRQTAPLVSGSLQREGLHTTPPPKPPPKGVCSLALVDQ